MSYSKGWIEDRKNSVCQLAKHLFAINFVELRMTHSQAPGPFPCGKNEVDQPSYCIILLLVISGLLRHGHILMENVSIAMSKVFPSCVREGDQSHFPPLKMTAHLCFRLPPYFQSLSPRIF